MTTLQSKSVEVGNNIALLTNIIVTSENKSVNIMSIFMEHTIYERFIFINTMMRNEQKPLPRYCDRQKHHAKLLNNIRPFSKSVKIEMQLVRAYSGI